MQNLVIVESPTKARTLSKYLGGDYKVEASMGHIRDLPKSDLGVDVTNDFAPKYIIPKDKNKKVNELQKIAKGCKTLWLATDPDREGEAIAWHLSKLLNDSQNSKLIKRVVFHEITEDAIKKAFEHPRDLDMQLVDAQQARRILDRLVGYKLSPLLWKKVKSGLSAGRVQSVALRLIVEREREIEAFKPEEYWSITASLNSADPVENAMGPVASVSQASALRGSALRRVRPRADKSALAVDARDLSSAPPTARVDSKIIEATLIEQNGKKIKIKNKEEAQGHLNNLEKAEYKVGKIIKKEVKKYPLPPFTTSTLQQTSSLKLGFSAKKTMMLAQTLYEHGLITYMRTDSVNLSDVALTSTRAYIKENFGSSYVPTGPKTYKTKSKLAQEAHEAIRPTNIGLIPEELKTIEGPTRDHIRLYDLIWKRMCACQMSEAVMDQTSVDINASCYTFRATGSVIKFDGWLKIYNKPTLQRSEEEEDREDEEKILPNLSEGELLELLNLSPDQHFTEGPPRYNEASLIKKLEELGIGRPSTYAPILSTIIDRFYIEKKDKKFFTTPLGIAVTDFLVKNFPDIFDYEFTASMEDEFDQIAQGEKKWQPIIKKFYQPFEHRLEEVSENAVKVKIEDEVIDKKCPKCNKNLIIKFGKFGKFLACSGFPDCKYTENFEEKVDAKCPDCSGEVVVRRTKKGRVFYGCKNWPKCKFASWTKPKGEASEKHQESEIKNEA